MGLKNLFARWRESADRQKLERVAEESQMTPLERAVDQEDYQARKDDTYVFDQTFAGAEAASTVDDDVEH